MPRPTQVPTSSLSSFRLRGYHTLWPAFPDHSTSSRIGNSTVAGPTTPGIARDALLRLHPVQRPVWAHPVSLAATTGITVVFFSTRY